MEKHRWLRYAVAAIVVAAAFWMSLFVASLIGWSFEPGGWHRMTENPGTLLLSFAVAAAGIALARLVTERPPLSWWLLLGALPPLSIALSEGGVV